MANVKAGSLVEGLGMYADLLEGRFERFQKTFIEKIAKRLAELARAEYLNAANFDDFYEMPVITYTVNGNTASVTASGNEVLFMEFGTGIPAASSPHPELNGDWILSEPLGAGTWSEGSRGKGHWNDPNGWYYKSPFGTIEWSQGVSGFKCMYNAQKQLEQEINKIANEAFEESK